MQIMVNRMINLTNYEPNDLIIDYPRANKLSIETDGKAQLTVQGHNVLSDTYYTLPILEPNSYDILMKITKAGIYEVDISAVGVVKVIPSKDDGTIYLKATSECVASSESTGGGSGEGTDDYNALKNKPSINGTTLKGSLTSDDLDMATNEDVSSQIQSAIGNALEADY